MRFRVEKLIRDRMAELMHAQGVRTFTRRLSDAEFVAALRAKLMEEAREAADASTPADLLEELADVAEVMLALAGTAGFGAAEIESRRLAKHHERGGFDDRTYNAAVEMAAGTPAAAYYLARRDDYPLEADGDG